MIRDLVLQNRTCRRFHQEVTIEFETLKELVDIARCSASALNMQPLKYILSCVPERNALIFPLLGFAAHLKDWPGPSDGERPSAYIIVLGDTEIGKATFDVDAGIATQSILLAAREEGLGGCMHGTVKRDELRQAFGIAPRYEILYVISLGKPKERSVLETIGPDGDYYYWRDSEGVHHVPKRRLDEIIID